MAIGQRSETVRRANLSAIVRVLHDRGPLTRSELVGLTGLTRSSIRILVGELVAGGLACEGAGSPDGTRGRPSPQVRLEPAAGAVLALDVAVDSIAGSLVGLGGVELVTRRIDRPRGRPTLEQVVDDLAALVSDILAAYPEVTVIGIGVAVVGVVRHSDGFVSTAPNLGWRNVPLGQRLGAALGLDLPILVANDADAGALGEYRRGTACDSSIVLFVRGEVGVGGGILIDGRPYTGLAGYSGEIGHFPINPAGRLCGCGAIGCLESEVGVDAILTRAGRPAKGGRQAFAEVLAAAASGSPRELAAFEEAGRWLGIGLSGFVNILNPGCIVLGGIFAASYPYISGAIEAALDRRALAAARGMVRIVPADLGDRAVLLGAAELAFEPLLADPAGWIGRMDARSTVASA